MLGHVIIFVIFVEKLGAAIASNEVFLTVNRMQLKDI
jgi:hypothetical protein